MFSTHTVSLIIILKIVRSLPVWKLSLLHSFSSTVWKNAFDASLLYCNSLIPPDTFTLSAMNEAYKFCSSASGGILPQHLWQTVLTQLQMITLPPFTLPICSDMIPACTLLFKADAKEYMFEFYVPPSEITCEGFFCPVAGQSAVQVDDSYVLISTLKDGGKMV